MILLIYLLVVFFFLFIFRFRWLVTPDWLLSSERAGYFVDEQKYGSRSTNNPLKGKLFSLSAGIKADKQKNSVVSTLLKLGKAKLTDDLAHTDYILTKDGEANDGGAKVLTFNGLLDLIQEKPPAEGTPRKKVEHSPGGGGSMVSPSKKGK